MRRARPTLARADLLGRSWSPLVSCLLACGREAPDRANAVQLPLLLLVLAAPGMAWMLRTRSRAARLVVLLLQLGLYGLYESGVSIETNIRVDVLLIYPAIGVTAALALRSRGGPRIPR